MSSNKHTHTPRKPTLPPGPKLRHRDRVVNGGRRDQRHGRTPHRQKRDLAEMIDTLEDLDSQEGK